MSNFRVGQKVVCVKDGVWTDQHIYKIYGLRAPLKGEVVTIRDIEIYEHGDKFFRFEEYKNPILEFKDGEAEIHFWSERFRPLVQRATDISIFKEILAGTRQPEGVEA